MGSYSPTPPSREEGLVREDQSSHQEIMAPYAVMPPPQAVRKPRPSWVTAPATYLLVGINCAVFLAMVGNGISLMKPMPEQLMHWGANNAGSVLLSAEWWRVVTAMFVHGGLLHLATNMWCLWNLGLLAEPLMGSIGVLGVYLLTGAAGNLLSTLAGWVKYNHEWAHYHAAGGTNVAEIFPPGVGASGAVFGIAGALIVLLKSNRLPVPPDELKKLRKSVIYFAALNLVLGFSINLGTRVLGYGLSIDNMAHLGGFTTGLLFAAPMVPRLGAPRRVFESRLRIAIGMLIALLVFFGFFLTSLVR